MGAVTQSRLFKYNKNGNLTEKTDRNDRVTEFDYDDLGRLTAERWMNEETGQTTIHTIAFDYDLAGQMKSAAEEDTSTTYSEYGYTYDRTGRLTGVAAAHLGVGATLVHGYDNAGLRTSTTATTLVGSTETDDFENIYYYDHLNRLKRVDQDDRGEAAVAEKRVDLAYDLAGQFAAIARYKDLDGGSTHEVATGTPSTRRAA